MMSDPYPIPGKSARTELIVLNSRFITSVSPAFSVEHAREFIDRIHSEFPDATHHVPAFLIGFGSRTIAHCSDAGEPAGTAGKPILAVLKGSGLGDVALVVTRYFGGTKLGTGGLARAYSQAAQSVLATLPRAIKRATHLTLLDVPYPYYERVRLLVSRYQGLVVDEAFAGEISLSIRFPVETFIAFQGALAELSAGSLQARILETNPDTVFPENISSHPGF